MKSLFSYVDIRKFSRGQKIRFAANIAIGIMIAVCLHVFEQTDWGENTINEAFDRVIVREAEDSARMSKGLAGQKTANISDRIMFVEIDDETYKKWGTPLITPRDKLAEILEAVSNGAAAVIVLDILLEEKDCCNPKGDDKLRAVLRQMAEADGPTKVIFLVKVGRDGGLKSNLFQDLIDGNPNFYVASAGISATAADRVIRYWVPFEDAKDKRLQKIVWNASLLASVVAEGDISEIRDCEKRIYNGEFHEEYHFNLSHQKKVTVSPDRDDWYGNRIRFFLIPKNTLSSHPGGNLFDNVCRVDEISGTTFRDKIVIIGNSSPDAGDMHPTPVGELAGMYVIGNAANTILLDIQPSRSPIWADVILEILAIVLAAFLFLHLQPALAHAVGSLIFLTGLNLLGYYWFLHTGMFLNFVFPVTAIGLHRTIANMESVALRRVREKS